MTQESLDLAIALQRLEISNALRQRVMDEFWAKKNLTPGAFVPVKGTTEARKAAPGTNPNAAAYNQVHKYPGGRW